MSLHTDEAEMQTHSAFRNTVEDLALAELERLESEEKSLTEALTSVKAEAKAARDVIRSLSPAEPKPKRVRPSRATKPKTLSEARRGEILAFLVDNKDDITTVSVMEALGWGESSVSTALNILRAEGIVRLAGTGGPRNMTKFYRSLI